MASRETLLSKDRLLSLDVFRGLTIAGMILVNSPGNETAYSALEHAAWNGWTPTDLVFPFFLFIVGVSLVFSFAKRLDQGEKQKDLLVQVIRRTLIIFGLGLLLNGFPHYQLSNLRIPGVLQRIALCYFFAAILYLKTRSPSPSTGRGVGGEGWIVKNEIVLFLITAGLLVGYWILMTRIPIPGYGAGNLTKEGNLAAFVDRALLSGHMYRPAYDPEGLLSTLPAIATTLLGVLTGCWLSTSDKKNKALKKLVVGIVGIVLGQIWGIWFPINKALWTSSYVLFTGGMALILFTACYWLIEVKGFKRSAWPFEVFGINAIAAYVLHILFLKVQNRIPMPRADATPGNLRFFITEHLFGHWTSPMNASLLYALSYTLLWLTFLSFLRRKRIFIKI